MAPIVQTPNVSLRGSLSDGRCLSNELGTRVGASKSLAGRFAIALLLFVLINIGCMVLSIGKGSPLDFPEMTWTAWTIRDFFGQRKKADIVFLGSSLVLVPVAGADADYLKRRLDGSQHHFSAYFESIFKQFTGSRISTYNFALPGEMPSDAYLATKFIFFGDRQPNVLVWGIGPRDFMDNLLPSPASTDPFRNLARFGDIGPIKDRVMSSWCERLSFLLGQLFYFYDKKEDWASKMVAHLSNLLNNCFFVRAQEKPLSIFDRRNLLPDYKLCELNRGEAFFRPQSREETERFSDNIAEYKKRYQSVKWDTFVTQMEFLSNTLDVAKERGIHVVLVMMPITKLNRSLIKDYAWDAYQHSIRVIAKAKGASLVDLYSSPHFRQSDFMDTVHLHAGGGKKMLDLLGSVLISDKAVRSALKIADPGLERVTARTTQESLARRMW